MGGSARRTRVRPATLTDEYDHSHPAAVDTKNQAPGLGDRWQEEGASGRRMDCGSRGEQARDYALSPLYPEIQSETGGLPEGNRISDLPRGL